MQSTGITLIGVRCFIAGRKIRRKLRNLDFTGMLPAVLRNSECSCTWALIPCELSSKEARPIKGPQRGAPTLCDFSPTKIIKNTFCSGVLLTCMLTTERLKKHSHISYFKTIKENTI